MQLLLQAFSQCFFKQFSVFWNTKIVFKQKTLNVYTCVPGLPTRAHKWQTRHKTLDSWINCHISKKLCIGGISSIGVYQLFVKIFYFSINKRTPFKNKNLTFSFFFSLSFFLWFSVLSTLTKTLQSSTNQKPTTNRNNNKSTLKQYSVDAYKSCQRKSHCCCCWLIGKAADGRQRERTDFIRPFEPFWLNSYEYSEPPALRSGDNSNDNNKRVLVVKPCRRATVFSAFIRFLQSAAASSPPESA